MLTYACAEYIIQRTTVMGGFLERERIEAETDAARVAEAIRKEAADLDQLCLSWSSWDDMLQFTNSADPRFVRSNLGPASLKNKRLDMVLCCKTNGEVAWHSIVDPDNGRAISLRDFPKERLLPSHPCLAMVANNIPCSGLFLNEYKAMLLSARPILASSGDGASGGTLILGRFVSDNLDELLTKQTRIDFDFWQMDPGHPLPPDVEGIRDELTASARPVIREQGPDLLHAFVTYNDYRGRPDFLIRANVGRSVSAAGALSVRFATFSTLTAGFILLFVLMSLLQKIVLTPLSRLTKHAVEIGKTENFRAKLQIQREDEIGVLARELNQMMVKLEDARAALVDSARSAGKSEIATGILHNVGNLLNSVNVSTELITDRIKNMRTGDLEKLASVLAEHGNDLAGFVRDDPRGKHLQPALAALSRHLAAQRADITKELASLGEGISCVRDLVKSQQNFAGSASIVEITDLAGQLRKAVELTDKAFSADCELEVRYELEPLPDVAIDRQRLMDILVNLVQNARQAMAAQGLKTNILTLKTGRLPGDRLRIIVSDTGCGIPPENLQKVFNMGFTTKPDGHGFGLHYAANAATEMGGALTASSDGEGRGASFVLELPLKLAATAEV